MTNDDIVLLDRAKNGDKNARNTIVSRNIGLVHKVVKRYYPRHHSYEDLVQEGLCGLLAAIDNFDPSRNVQFSTYAIPRIKSYVISAITQGVCKDMTSRRVYWNSGKVSTAIWQETGEQPTQEEIAERLAVDPDYVSAVQAALTPTMEYVDISESSIESVEDKLLREATELEIRRAVGQLTYRERVIVRQRHFKEDGDSLRVIGEELGISGERVRQLESRAKKKLKVSLEKLDER